MKMRREKKEWASPEPPDGDILTPMFADNEDGWAISMARSLGIPIPDMAADLARELPQITKTVKEILS